MCVYVCVYACVWTHMQSVTQSCPTLCDPMDYSPPDSPVHGIFQARIPKWVAISYSKDLPNPGIEPMSLVSPAMAVRFFTWPQSKGTGLLQGMCSSWEACIQGLADLIVKIIRAIVTVQDNLMSFKCQWE